jgi:hypothetical protein
LSIFRESVSQKPQSDEKWYKISVEKEYMEPDPWSFGRLDPDLDLSESDPAQILVLFEEKGNSMFWPAGSRSGSVGIGSSPDPGLI